MPATEYPVNMTALNVKKTLEINKNAVACAGVLRMDGAGTWGWINDANHGPINFDPTVTQDTSKITLPFNPATTKLGGVVVGPDESFAGIFEAGGSIVNGPGGSARISIKRTRPIIGTATYNGGSGLFDTTGTEGDAGVSPMTATVAAGVMTVTYNRPMPSDSVVVDIQRKGDAFPKLLTSSATGFTCSFQDGSFGAITDPTKMNIAFVAHPGLNELNPSTININEYPSCNFWVVGYNNIDLSV